MYFDQQQQQENNGPPVAQAKMIINTEDIKFIVYRLQQEPFGDNISLVEFDDLNALELLELLNKVLAKMDDQIHNVNVREELQQNTISRIVEFLKVINFPVGDNEQYNLGIVQGEKRVIYPILFYILQKWEELQTRAYLARYLVPLHIPEEIVADIEVSDIYQQYKDLQAEFQVIHQQLEVGQKEMMKPGELKVQIQRQEQEKEQLNNKITIMKNKNNNNSANKEQFQRLLEVTNGLRLEQEEEQNISDKIRNQKQQQEWTDQQLLQSQQRLIDVKKQVTGDSPDQMLVHLRNELRRNREMAQHRLALEIGDKKKKLAQYERMLKEPPVTSQELNHYENQMVLLDKDVRAMTERLKQINPADDKLAIYKQQANLVIKKKEKIQQQFKKLEEQQQKLEKEIAQKSADLNKQRGPGYGKTNDDFKVYANKLKEKQAKFRKQKDELKAIVNEIGVLARTEAIVNQRKEQLEAQVQKNEREKGILGYGQIKEENEMISEQKEQIDQQKTQKLEQITEIVGNIQKELGMKKEKLTKQVNQLKELKNAYNDIHAQTYAHKKNEYDQIMTTINNENTQLQDAITKLKDIVYKDDTKIEMHEFQKKLYDLKLQRLNDENSYNKGNSRLDENNKTYKDYFKNKISKQELEIKQIKLQRDVIKENHEPSLKQLNMFNNLQKLLQVKIQLASNGQSNANYSKQGNIDRLVL